MGWSWLISKDTLAFGFRFTSQHHELGIMWKRLQQIVQILLLWRRWVSALEVWRKSCLHVLFPAHMSHSHNYPAPAFLHCHCCPPHEDGFAKLEETVAHSVLTVSFNDYLLFSFRVARRMVFLILSPPSVFDLLPRCITHSDSDSCCYEGCCHENAFAPFLFRKITNFPLCSCR